MDVLKLGVKLELQPWAYTTATATPDPSHVCDLHHSSRQHQIPNPLNEARYQSSWILVRFLTTEPQRELLQPFFYVFVPQIDTDSCYEPSARLERGSQSWTRQALLPGPWPCWDGTAVCLWICFSPNIVMWARKPLLCIPQWLCEFWAQHRCHFRTEVPDGPSSLLYTVQHSKCAWGLPNFTSSLLSDAHPLLSPKIVLFSQCLGACFSSRLPPQRGQTLALQMMQPATWIPGPLLPIHSFTHSFIRC